MEQVRIDAERGEGFVAFVSPQAAAMLLQEKPTIVFMGQQADLTWGKAKPLSERLAASVQHGATRNLYLGNLPSGATDQALLAVFRQFGEIESVRVMRNQLGFGYVNFTSIENACAAREQCGRMLKVAFLAGPYLATTGSSGCI